MIDTIKLLLIDTWSLELKFMLTEKRKTTWANNSFTCLSWLPLKARKKVILNPAHNSQKKRDESSEITIKSQRVHFSTVSLNSGCYVKNYSPDKILSIDSYCMGQTTET